MARGLHSSTFQLYISRFCHFIHPRHPAYPKQLLTLRRKVDECKPLVVAQKFSFSWLSTSTD